MRRTLVLAGIASSLFWSVPSDAVVIDFVPGSQTVPLGAAAAVDLVISGLGDFSAPSLGAFDLDVAYDASILTATSVTLTSLLGDGALGETIEGLDLSVPGLIDLFVISFLSPIELDSLQPGSFVLATLSFDAIAPGTSALSLTQVLLGDATGTSLDPTAGAGSITVTRPGTQVPEPSSSGLLLTGGLVLLLTCRRSRAGSVRS